MTAAGKQGKKKQQQGEAKDTPDMTEQVVNHARKRPGR
jgi:hypothetical protein